MRQITVELDQKTIEDLHLMKVYEADESFARHVAYDLVDLMIDQHPEEMKEWTTDED